MNNSSDQYDYIVVGAGSAGCTLAYRLSADAGCRVLLLEAGGRDTSPIIHIPLGFAFLMKHPALNWCYQTEPEPHMNDRTLAWPRGKVLGGTSSINGMVYIRGQPEDYDHWHTLGNDGWSYEEVLPYFRRSENKAEGGNTWHGQGGPLWVEEVPESEKLALADLFIQASVETGLPYNHDFNGPGQEGAGYYQLNIRNGRRQSTARTFLKACRHRPNLTIVTGALVRRLHIDNGRATGVEFCRTNRGKPRIVQATVRWEIILCAGVINSPQLLELSGIGNSERLQSLSIPLQKHLPGVGENLQDHLTINIQQGMHGVPSFFDETRPLRMVGNLVRYAFQRRGLLAHPAAQAGVFFRAGEGAQTPDAQVHFAPAASEEDSQGNLKTRPGTTATVCYLRPESRGSVHIRSTDATAAPEIRANYLDSEVDCKAMIAAVRRVREIFAASVLDQYRGREFRPGSAVQTDEAILAYIRAEAESVYHPVGTCKMGRDSMAVVDPRLRVHGIEKLRVADASLMPTITSGNTNAPSIMIAEKCADMLLQDNGTSITAASGA